MYTLLCIRRHEVAPIDQQFIMRGLRDPYPDMISRSTVYLPYSPVLDINERSSTNIIQIYIPYSSWSKRNSRNEIIYFEQSL